MNGKRFVLATLAAAASITTQTAFAVGADDTWLEYAQKKGLPLAVTSDPGVPDDWLIMEMSFTDGNADRSGMVRALKSRHYGNGNGNGNGGNGHAAPAKKDACAEPLTREVARTDGNAAGDDLRCKSKAP